MIEAVNSVLVNAPLLRGSANKVDVSNSFAANPDRVQAVHSGPSAPFVSPFISFDHNRAVLQIRDSDTGDVITQFPSEAAIKARQKAVVSDAEVRSFEPLIAGEDAVLSDVSGSFGVRDVGFEAVSFGSSEQVSSSGSAEAQVAAAALVSSAQTGVPSESNVSVTA